jgi:two-component system, sensor histidine kinase and response regulator
MSPIDNLASQAVTSPSHKLLVVDDIPDNLIVIGAILGMEDGYQLSYADNGPEALEVVEASPPDLILLDVMMPGMTGYEVIHRIRQNSSLPYVPIVLMTARNELSIAEGLAAGADGFLRKPFDMKELLTCIQLTVRAFSTYSGSKFRHLLWIVCSELRLHYP